MHLKFIQFCLLISFVHTAGAITPTVDESELLPNKDQEQATEIILHIIENYHYRTRVLDDELSSEIFDSYLESMDPNKSFFTLSDIDEFENFRYTLDDASMILNSIPHLIFSDDIAQGYRNVSNML